MRICDEIGASGHIPVKHLADSNGSRYKTTIADFCKKLNPLIEEKREQTDQEDLLLFSKRKAQAAEEEDI